MSTGSRGEYFNPKGMRMESGQALQNDKLYCLYHSPNIFMMIKSRRLGWAGHVARMREGRISFKILTGKPIGNRSLGKPRRRCEGNFRICLK